MKFDTLTLLDWPRYLAHHARFDGMWIFQHVPKTAGSSITAALDAHAAPYTNVFADRASDVPLRAQYRELAGTIPLERDGVAMRSVSGHLWRTDIDILLSRAPDARLFTFVRDPVRRVISDFRYSRTPAHADWQRQIATFPDLDAYIEGSPAVRNKITFFLAGQRNGDPDKIVPWILSRFDYIGLVEEMPLSHHILARLLSMDGATVEHRRSTEDVAENAEPPTPGQIDRIRAMNSLDQALFDKVSLVHSQLKDSLLGEIAE